MIEMTEARTETDRPEDAVIKVYETTGYSRVVIAVGIVAMIPALLLEGVLRNLVIGGIFLVVAGLMEYYEFEVDRSRREIKIRTLWWGLFERRSKTYSFSDVKHFQKAELGGDGTNGYRWKFQDGATYELFAPVDPRLTELFLEDYVGQRV